MVALLDSRSEADEEQRNRAVQYLVHLGPKAHFVKGMVAELLRSGRTDEKLKGPLDDLLRKLGDE